MLGILFAFSAVIFIGLSAISAKRGLERVDILVGTSIAVFVGSAIFLLLSIIFIDVGILQTMNPYAVGYFAAAGLVHFFIGTLFKHTSIKKIGASRAESIIGSTPLIAVVLAVITLGEQVSLPIGVGTGLVIIGIYFVATS